ncbi:hypothetical protein DCC85_03500 [Paenibacillus sp. CAA11]|uniref:CAP domain-containing protein n=1 Tax=Paenibacillus sp. CAA11 TaxID=1532905 RepID=UPI000D387F6A|nr:CAP domain-containing protein [Paenibacillus sp. CAA11]AWB43376.1 hypothetical protein DCC85_03500 [Paenibacillus sp. CAA11]
MKHRMIKHWVTGGMAVLLTVGIMLPTSASAASSQTTFNWSTYFQNVNVQQWLQQQQSNWSAGNTQTKKQTQTQTQTQTGKQGTTNSTQNNTTATDKSQFTAEVIRLVNQERAKQGLKALTGDASLNNMALAKAKDMSQNNYFDHTSPTYGSPFDMMKKFNISYNYAGENIAKGQKTPAEVVQAWMNSAGHRANILNANYNLIGVGYYNGYWAQEFVGRS